MMFGNEVELVTSELREAANAWRSSWLEGLFVSAVVLVRAIFVVMVVLLAIVAVVGGVMLMVGGLVVAFRYEWWAGLIGLLPSALIATGAAIRYRSY